MNSIERFYATVAREPVDRPACWLGDPTPEAAEKLCKHYNVPSVSELKKFAAMISMPSRFPTTPPPATPSSLPSTGT